jgi:hypothetical protein
VAPVEFGAQRIAALRAALGGGALLWLLLLIVGFFAPGGWHWGWPGAIGHMINYMIALWLVTLVLAPLLALRDPLARTAAIQIYLLGLLGIVVSTLRGEHPMLASDALPLAVVALSVGLVAWAHPRRSELWRV